MLHLTDNELIWHSGRAQLIRGMALLYYPQPGEIVLCDYGSGFVPPEMVKRRPVVVVSPRLRRRADLVTIVPLSTTAPAPVETYHHQITLARPLPPPFHSPTMWAKCDMIAAVAKSRLDRFKSPHVGATPRKWLTGAVTAADLSEIRRCMLHALGLSSLTVHL